MSFHVTYVTMITKAPKRDKAEVMVTKVRFRVVFPMAPKLNVVGISVVGAETAMLSTN